MQYQAGSWYLPWGIPIQKMITMPYGQQGSTPMDTYLTTNNTPLTCHVLTNPHQSNVNANVVSPLSVQATATSGTSNYQHAAFNHHTVGKFGCANSVENLHGSASMSSVQHPGASIPSSILNSHTRAILPNSQHSQHHQNILIPPTIFSSLTMPTYLPSPTATASAINVPMAGLPSSRTNLSDCSRLISQQQQPSHNTNSTTSPLACISTTSTPPNRTIPTSINLNVDVVAMRHHVNNVNAPTSNLPISLTKVSCVNLLPDHISFKKTPCIHHDLMYIKFFFSLQI